MSLHKHLRLVICGLSVALALGIAACGGGSESPTTSDPAAVQRTAIATAIQGARTAVEALGAASTDADVTTAEAAITAAKKAVTDAAALAEAEKLAYSQTISLLEGNLGPARMRIATARKAEAARLIAAFEGPGIGAFAASVKHGAAPVIKGTILGATPVPVPRLETALVPNSTKTSDGWIGGTYTATDAAAGTRDTVVLYTDIAAPGSRPFSGQGGKYTGANGLAMNGSLPIVAGTDATLIASASFPTSAGIREHMAGGNGTVNVPGTFDGAQGAYVCTPSQRSPCTSSVKHGGGIALAGGGGWSFVPAPGATVAEPDGEYGYFGWWQRASGDTYSIAAFHAGVGASATEFASLRALQGSAAYRGPAVGMYAIPGDDASSGEFTATASLVAEFGDAAALGTVTGTVEGFTVGGSTVPWSVALGAAGIAGDGTIAASGSDTARTVWSIEGTAGTVPSASPPSWRGSFREAGEDQVPTSATGTFEAAHGEGRMIGAFGTTRRQ